MPPERKWRFRVEDMRAAIDSIFKYVEGMDFEAFSRDAKTRDAVILNLAVLGEAARHVPDVVRAQYPHIEWDEMIANRNVMIHIYFGLKPEILWDTIQKDLPQVQRHLRELLDSFDRL